MSNLFPTWPKSTRILVILAHPDDPEFFLGGTIAFWSASGYNVQYCLLTRGEKGVSSQYPNPWELASVRQLEQAQAASVLGVSQIEFMDYPDGYLIPSLQSRKDVVKTIRRIKPDVVVSCDPQYLYGNHGNLNHPDHRAAGQVVVDAVFPAAGNPSYFPEILNEGLEPWAPSELWLSLPSNPTIELDVSDFWEQRKQALMRHKSQIGDPQQFNDNLEKRRLNDGGVAGAYIEKFRRIIFQELQ